jgi:FMN-dependent NADH-azoreductase
MNVLIVNSTAQGDRSLSNRLTAAFVDGLRTGHSDLTVTLRDVGGDPVPHLVSGTVAAIRGVAETGAERQALVLSDTLIDELHAADLVVIGAPMYNFGIASTLKSWFDHVLRARVTFRYTEAGPEGLLTGKQAVVIETRAGIYSEGPAAAMDHQEPHIRTLLAFMGITDVRFVRVEGAAFGPEAADAAEAKALAQLGDLASRPLARAA